MRMTKAQREGFGDALRSEREAAGLTQVALAEKLGTRSEYPEGITSSGVGQWETALTLPEGPAQVFALEEVLGVPAGRLSRHLGFVPVEGAEVDVLTAIDEDPELTPERRDELAALYRLYLSRSKRRK